MAEEWTVVGRRRAARICRSKSAFPSGLLPPQAEECDTALVLLRLKRSIARVQGSAFFRRFLRQVQSAPVCDLLSRAKLTLCSKLLHGRLQGLQEDGDLHHNLGLPRDVPPEGSAERVMKGCSRSSLSASLPLESLVAENAEDIALASLLCAVEVLVCDHSQNVLEASIDSLKSISGTSVSATECQCTIGCGCGFACSTSDLEGHTERGCLDVVLYGLGSIAYSEASRCQLALILLLKERFSWVGIIEVYDPVLSHSECTVIKELGCLPVALNEKGRRPIAGPTLFYMPHCEGWLYDNLLQANWAPCAFRQIVILGNSFKAYQEIWSSPVGRKSPRPSYLLQYQQLAKEVPLEATPSSDPPGFNNMSWHFYDLCSNL
ncbi:hypothetical protein L7F22_040453 [Adiantum nelumboides]|nr:hypothetical protein [Adiantum nelumboides]